MRKIKQGWPLVAASAATAVVCLGMGVTAQASSHREAPFITSAPKVDGTDFYMFRSYGDDAATDSVTLIANYDPLQASYGGPNYFELDPNAVYEIHIDNDGDAVEDLTFQFKFNNVFNVPAVPAGQDAEGNDVTTTVPLVNIGPTEAGDDNANLSVIQNYTVNLIRGDRRTGSASALTSSDGGSTFIKPMANIGNKSFPDYESYADQYMYSVNIPGCDTQGKLFAGQRKEGFVVNLGELFDLVNQNSADAPVAPGYARNAGRNILADKNITSLALQVPTSCLITGTDSPSIGGWTTASLPQAGVLNPNPQTPNTDSNTGSQVRGGPLSQVSRLGSPLVNEVVIGLDQKDRFNTSEPVDDPQFLQFVTNPSLPVLVTALFPAVQTPANPRSDLVSAFLTGLLLQDGDGNVVFSNQVGTGTPTPGEMLRLNTAVAPVALADQNSLGLLACDTSGFPNGRRPFDDIVDIELNAAEGAITADNPNSLQTCDVSSGTPTIVNEGNVVTDGALPNRAEYDSSFPYLQTPIPGSPNTAADDASTDDANDG
ncbi:DUF4331 domain-containing protein [Salinisphaera aquimarina]|uniref:DUF4331 domain-containing protein n=1 Tax=Salinisphaera aquimarina TaxID=2094031 RepID=A0ABV7EMB3_9GAMM